VGSDARRRDAGDAGAHRRGAARLSAAAVASRPAAESFPHLGPGSPAPVFKPLAAVREANACGPDPDTTPASIFQQPAKAPIAARPAQPKARRFIPPEDRFQSGFHDPLTAYEVGASKYEELAKGQMLGAETGLLKILFHSKTLQILGVHAIGENATEIIDIGQAVLALGATIEYFRDTTFNYPTLAEAYKVAGLDGLNRL
jgi:pyruvate/2-oxoglutarate dehydrogenase complex dihydrolipoamide dehydrogenase (E3) component